MYVQCRRPESSFLLLYSRVHPLSWCLRASVIRPMSVGPCSVFRHPLNRFYQKPLDGFILNFTESYIYSINVLKSWYFFFRFCICFFNFLFFFQNLNIVHFQYIFYSSSVTWGNVYSQVYTHRRTVSKKYM